MLGRFRSLRRLFMHRGSLPPSPSNRNNPLYFLLHFFLFSNLHLSVQLLATTVMYLAAKSQESPRQLRDVVNVSFRCLHPHRPPLSVGSLYERLRESVVNSELIVLRYLQFDTRFESPHKVSERMQLFVCP